VAQHLVSRGPVCVGRHCKASVGALAPAGVEQSLRRKL